VNTKALILTLSVAISTVIIQDTKILDRKWMNLLHSMDLGGVTHYAACGSIHTRRMICSDDFTRIGKTDLPVIGPITGPLHERSRYLSKAGLPPTWNHPVGTATSIFTANRPRLRTAKSSFQPGSPGGSGRNSPTFYSGIPATSHWRWSKPR
jgi:hypothetical protein